ncbi:MAG: peptidoglycan-binding domain-containing protein [Chthoniobacterales bacterium]
MKSILYSICIGTLALALTAWGEQVQGTGSAKTKANARGAASAQHARTGSATVRNAAAVKTRDNVSAARFHPRTSATVRERGVTNVRSSRVQPRSQVAANHARNVDLNRARSFNRDQNVAINRQRNAAVARERSLAVNRQQNAAFNRGRNLAFARQQNAAISRERNARITNNWRSARFSGQSYAAFRNYHRQWHDRGWWRSNYDRIIFVSSGWYYWNSGYWYPAWGYASGAYYPYDGPIYGYNDLTPDQVVVNVQAQLQRDGYYSGPVDGVLGPMTRQAIAAFQADHGLAVTSAVDRPTLSSLGLA